jgi:predicted DNA-binding ArsR family transcriptional regulator
MKTCFKCGEQLRAYDSAIYRKLVNMLADEFMCISCLAEHFGCEESSIYAQIEYFKQKGTCGLFRY